MKEKQFESRPPEPAPERGDVHLKNSPLRCPFCHDDVSVEQDEWNACEQCLGRHHRACWEEAGACSACGGQSRLRPTPVAETESQDTKQKELRGKARRKAQISLALSTRAMAMALAGATGMFRFAGTRVVFFVGGAIAIASIASIAFALTRGGSQGQESPGREDDPTAKP